MGWHGIVRVSENGVGSAPEVGGRIERQILRFQHDISSLRRLMKISIFGLGYVGAVTAGCLAQQGHQVVGVDVSEQKVQTLNRGESPIIEPGLEDLLKQARQRGLLRACTDAAEAVAATDLSLVCVGTPVTVSGAIDLGFVRQVSEQIAAALRGRPKSHALVFRSTMLPGSTRRLVEQLLRISSGPGGWRFFTFRNFYAREQRWKIF